MSCDAPKTFHVDSWVVEWEQSGVRMLFCEGCIVEVTRYGQKIPPMELWEWDLTARAKATMRLFEKYC